MKKNTLDHDAERVSRLLEAIDEGRLNARQAIAVHCFGVEHTDRLIAQVEAGTLTLAEALTLRCPNQLCPWHYTPDPNNWIALGLSARFELGSGTKLVELETLLEALDEEVGYGVRLDDHLDDILAELNRCPSAPIKFSWFPTRTVRPRRLIVSGIRPRPRPRRLSHEWSDR